MVNLARSAALAYAITTLTSSLSALVQLSWILLFLNQETHHKHRPETLKNVNSFVSPGELGHNFHHADKIKVKSSEL